MALANFAGKSLRFMVSAGIGVFLAFRFPYGPIPYLEPFIKRYDEIESSKAYRELDTINDIIHKKGQAAKSMTVGELAKEMKYMGGFDQIQR